MFMQFWERNTRICYTNLVEKLTQWYIFLSNNHSHPYIHVFFYLLFTTLTIFVLWMNLEGNIRNCYPAQTNLIWKNVLWCSPIYTVKTIKTCLGREARISGTILGDSEHRLCGDILQGVRPEPNLDHQISHRQGIFNIITFWNITNTIKCYSTRTSLIMN